MIFYNPGDGYSSGCCTVNLCRFAHEDKKYFSMVEREHPDNRPGSFVNQLAELYKASTITEAHPELQYKRCPIVIVITKQI